MPLVPLARIPPSWVGLILLAVAAYLVWSWWYGEIGVDTVGVTVRLRENWRLWTALAIVVFSLLGRFPVVFSGEARHRSDPPDTLGRPDGRQPERLHNELRCLSDQSDSQAVKV